MNKKGLIILTVVVVVLAIAGFIKIRKGCVFLCQGGKIEDKAVYNAEDPTPDWKTYRNTQYGFEFKYPNKLKLSQQGEKVVLNHSIPYENNGNCDMSGDSTIYPTLDD